MPKKIGLATFLASSALLACGGEKTSAPAHRPLIGISNASVTFEAMRGAADPQAQTISVFNSGTGSLDGLTIDGTTYGSGQPGGWLAAVLEGSAAPATLRLTVTLGVLPVGQYTAQVRLKATASGVANSPTSITVNLTVTLPPTIQFTTTTVSFSGHRLAPNPVAQVVAVTNGGTGTLNGLTVGSITYAAGQPSGWLTASISSTTAPTTLTLSADGGAVPAGAYSATVAVVSTAPLITNSPQMITVTLSVLPARPRLSIVSAPAGGVTGTKLSEPIRVEVLEGERDVLLTDYLLPITASMVTPGALSGTLTVTPTGGRAVFDSVIVNAAGTYVIAFDASGAVRASNTITMSAPPGGTLVVRPPSSPTIEADDVWRVNQVVEVRDVSGVLVNYPVQVRVALLRGPGLVISGDTTTSVAGLATFPALRLSGKPEGFTAEFLANGFTSGTRDYFPAVAGGFSSPSLLNARDSVVRMDSIFTVDQIVSATSPIGSLRFDVHWNPSVLSLVSDSVMIANATLLANRAAINSGTYAVTLSSSGGVASGTRFIRMRFKVIASSQFAIVETLTVEARTTAGVLLQSGRRILQVRIP